jgi:hypothetical protein
MNKKIFFALPISVLFAGCAMQGAEQAMMMPPPEQKGCTKMSYPPNCIDNARIVTINVNSGVVAPSFVCAESGKSLTYQIKPDGTDDAVAVVLPKVKADTWLVGINDPDPAKIEVQVPSKPQPKSSLHDYYVVTTGGHCFDPRIEVDPGN